MPAVKLILQRRESHKQLPGRRTLQNLYGIGCDGGMVTNKWIWSGWISKVRIGHSRSMQIAVMARRKASAISPLSIRLRYFGHHITWYAVW